MILILSRESADITTDVVLDWLNSYKAEYFRFNGEDLLNGKCIVNFHLEEDKWSFIIQYKDITIHSDTIHAIWFRRSFDWDIEKRFWDAPKTIENYKFLHELNSYHQTEIRTVYNLIEQVLHDRYWLNIPSKADSDKFRTLLIAKKIGFKVPHTLVSNNQESVKSFVNTHTTCITKPSQDGTFITGTDFGVSTITKMINNDTFRSFEKVFFTPSLFQKLIDKEYEIRVIFIENQIFSVGIFSQTNEKTKIDYRNYDSDKPNRLQLISLPKSVEKNIRQLMQELKINFGSIDLIKAIDGGYYFLEINPVGQFLGISNILNLKIERIIAQILKDKDEL